MSHDPESDWEVGEPTTPTIQIRKNTSTDGYMEVVEDSTFTPVGEKGGRREVDIRTVTTVKGEESKVLDWTASQHPPHRPPSTVASKPKGTDRDHHTDRHPNRHHDPHPPPHPDISTLKEKLRSREQDVLHSVGLGQTILEDLQKTKKKLSRAKHENQKVTHELGTLREKFSLAAENFFETAQAALEEKARVISGTALFCNRQLQKEVTTLRSVRSEQDSVAGTLSHQLRQLQDDIHTLEKEREVRVEFDSEELNKLAEDAAKLRTEVNRARQLAHTTEASNRTKDQQIIELQNLLAEARAASNSGALVEVLKLENATLKKDVSGLNHKLQSYEDEVHELRSSIAERQGREDLGKRKLADLSKDVEDLRADRHRLLQNKSTLQKEVSVAVEQSKSTKVKYDLLKEKWERERSTMKTKLEDAEDRISGARKQGREVHEELKKVVELNKNLATAGDATGKAALLQVELERLSEERRKLLTSLEDNVFEQYEGEGEVQVDSATMRVIRSLNAQITSLRVYVETEAATNASLRSDNEVLRNDALHVERLWEEKLAGVKSRMGDVEVLRHEKQSLTETTHTLEEKVESLRRELKADKVRKAPGAALNEENASLRQQVEGLRADNDFLRLELKQGVEPRRPHTPSALSDVTQAPSGDLEVKVAPLTPQSSCASHDIEIRDEGWDDEAQVSPMSTSCAGKYSPLPPRPTPNVDYWVGVGGTEEQDMELQVESARAEVDMLRQYNSIRRQFSLSCSPGRGRSPSVILEGDHTSTLRALHQEIAASRGDLDMILNNDPASAARTCLASISRSISPAIDREGAANIDALLTEQLVHQQSREATMKRVTEVLTEQLYRNSPAAAAYAVEEHR